MPLKVRLTKTTADALTACAARATAAFKQLTKAADKIGDAADEVTKATGDAGRPDVRAWSAWSWASLLDRIFRR